MTEIQDTVILRYAPASTPQRNLHTMTDTTIDTARLTVLEARTAISDLIHRYAQGVRNGDYESCISLFAADATFEVRLAAPGEKSAAITRSKLNVHAELLAYLREAAASSGGMCPLISNVLIDVRDHQATSNCMMAATAWSSGKTTIGEYDDAFNYTDRWLFNSRVYTIFRPRT
jgi:SnoaL-like domain